ncbi:MAG TPA: NAD-dependent epimerase/dehydratase family protein [Solirubrobacteraceae bacterium]|nr:NAD-dependent epimerase/dehydratase family protein [Solirubrobacteraceae bacterium]
MPSRRILITGLSTHWGGRLARALEQDPDVETVIGVDRTPPKIELERTEFVRVADSHSLIRRIVEAAEIDTVVDTRLVVDSIVTTPRRAHENNVVGTMNVLAACGGPSSPVRKVVFKSSAHYYGAERDDPAFFTEDMRRPHPPRTLLERDICDAEATVRDFANRHRDVTVTVLRFANGLGASVRSSAMALLSLPVVPGILGFDPRYQVIHEDDMTAVLEHAVRHDLGGVFNCAADGVLVLSEAVSLLGKPWAPVLPPWGTGLAAGALRRAGVRIPPEMLQLLRYGRALDNRRLKATGYRYRFTTRETLLDLRRRQRLAPFLEPRSAYRYEREVEEFLRRSPSVRHALPAADAAEPPANRPAAGGRAALAAAPRPSGDGYDGLRADEVIALLPSLDPDGLRALRAHEAAHLARKTVLAAIDRLLANRA